MPLPDHLPLPVRAAVLEAKARLEALYGDRLVRVVLYGSHARGDARPDSDVDLLVVLHEPYDAYPEGKRISALRLQLSTRYGVDVSMQPYGDAEVADPGHPLMHNVAEDGVAV